MESEGQGVKELVELFVHLQYLRLSDTVRQVLSKVFESFKWAFFRGCSQLEGIWIVHPKAICLDMGHMGRPTLVDGIHRYSGSGLFSNQQIGIYLVILLGCFANLLCFIAAILEFD